MLLGGFVLFLLTGLSLVLGGIKFMLEYYLYRGVRSISFVLLLDWIGTLFLAVVFFIRSMVLFYRKSYIGREPNGKRFCALVILFVMSIGLFILSPNLISLLLGWDGLGLISYCLVIFYQNSKSFNSGILTVLMNRVGDVGILLGIGLLATEGS